MGNSYLTLVDLFCGGGGASAGYHMAGFKSVFAMDVAEHCVNTYNLNFGNVAHLGDISTLHAYKILENLDDFPFLVTASPPCEPYTKANERRIKDPYYRMFDDPIGRLMLDAIRLIGDLEPKFYIIENVIGVLDGNNDELIADEFERVGFSRPHFNVLEAAEWGIPSKRKRVFISNVKFDSPKLPSRTVRDAIGDLIPPQYPNDFEDHVFVPVPPKYASKVISLPEGQGLVYFKGAKNQYVNYLRLNMDKPADVVMGKSRFLHPIEDRLLSPREHARLMTFPDAHKLSGSLEQMYDIVGEAIPSLLTYQLAKTILDKARF